MTITRPLLIAMLALLLLLARSGFGSDDKLAEAGPESRFVTVEIRNLKFVPSELNVAPGTTIRWINLDPLDHDVTSGVSVTGRNTRNMQKTRFPDDKFASGLFGKDESFSVTLLEKGEYQYYCNIHPFMSARIVVK